jgi:hypothetical protein
MKFVALFLGIAIMFVVLFDAFEVMMESFARLRELRAMYEPFIEALSDYFKFDLPPIALAEAPVDNWQRSPWQQSAPGIGSLPIANPGDHFS